MWPRERGAVNDKCRPLFQRRERADLLPRRADGVLQAAVVAQVLVAVELDDIAQAGKAVVGNKVVAVLVRNDLP